MSFPDLKKRLNMTYYYMEVKMRGESITFIKD